MAENTSNNVELLAHLPPGLETHNFRFLVDGKHVKYISFEKDAIPEGGEFFPPSPVPPLPHFPPGDWNQGIISRDPVTTRLALTRFTRANIPGIQNIWHPKQFDYFEFEVFRHLTQNVQVATHPTFNRPVVVKFAQFPRDIPKFETETTTYEWIDGEGIGPEFLGHLTEDGRVVGFVIEYIDGTEPANEDDIDAFWVALAKLHGLGICHGDMHEGNVVIRDGEAVIIDFQYAHRTDDADLLQDECNLVAATWIRNIKHVRRASVYSQSSSDEEDSLISET